MSIQEATSVGNCGRKLPRRRGRMDLFGERGRQVCLSPFPTKLALGKNQSIFAHFKQNNRRQKRIMKHEVCRQVERDKIFSSKHKSREESLKLRASFALENVLSISLIIKLFMILMLSNPYRVIEASSQVFLNRLEAQQQQDVLLQDHYLKPLALISESRGEKPKLIPLIAADSGYSENSSVTFLCTVSQGHHETLTFDWFKDGQLLLPPPPPPQPGSAAANHNQMRLSSGETMSENETGEQVSLTSNLMPQIDKNPDHSLLRISRVSSQHAGRYTCLAKNQFGQDSSSVNLAVNGNYIRLQFGPNVIPLVLPHICILARAKSRIAKGKTNGNFLDLNIINQNNNIYLPPSPKLSAISRLNQSLVFLQTNKLQ